MTARCLALVALCFLASLCRGQVVAQQRDAGGWQYGGHSYSIYYLLNQQLQSELEIVADQKDQLQQLQKDSATKMQEFNKSLENVPLQDRTAKWMEFSRTSSEETEKKVQAILLPHQKKRLNQIMLQMKMQQMGYGSAAAFAGEDVAKELGITEQQREDLKKKEAELRTEMQRKTQEFYKKLQEETREELFSVLTPDQRKKLDGLFGEKFEWKWQAPGQPANPAKK